MLYTILKEAYYLDTKLKEKYIDNICENRLNDDDEEEMKKIKMNEELINRLKTKAIASFSYPQLEYSFSIYERFYIIPSFDGNRFEFLINPPLPEGITIDNENGIIYGTANEIEKKEYEINCKNKLSEKKIKI